jgi:putative intracellular protease/amidase
METAGELEGGGKRSRLLSAVVAGLAALFAAALALGPLGGVPRERVLRLATAADTPARPAVAAAGGTAAWPGAPVLCFRGPRGEPVDFPVVQHCR